MMGRKKIQYTVGSDRGSVLLILAAAMVFLLGVCALAIDMANLYLARAQAQRAADAAALAGAKAFLNTGCATSGCTAGGIQETVGRQQAEAIGAQNLIAGTAAVIKNSDVTFSYPNAWEPQITVVAQAAVSTFFAKIFGIDSSNVSATATAEAYNPAGGGGVQIGTACLRPFLVPNCDPDPAHASPSNPTCNNPGQGPGTFGYFFDSSGNLAHPGTYPAGIIGMPWQLHTESGPSQWYLVGFDNAPPSSGSALRNHIVACTSAIYSCGTTLTTTNGKNVGPVSQGIEALINANGDGFGEGQDSIDTSVGPPFAITGGSNNSNAELRGKVFYDYSQSASVVSVPVYDGSDLPPGGTGVQIVGYLQVFVQDVVHRGNDNHIDVVILNGSLCGGGAPGSGGGGGGTIVAAGGSPIPIRLIRTN